MNKDTVNISFAMYLNPGRWFTWPYKTWNNLMRNHLIILCGNHRFVIDDLPKWSFLLGFGKSAQNQKSNIFKLWCRYKTIINMYVLPFMFFCCFFKDLVPVWPSVIGLLFQACDDVSFIFLMESDITRLKRQD